MAGAGPGFSILFSRADRAFPFAIVSCLSLSLPSCSVWSRGQALGLAVAGALALGYSNIFVTAPSPENLRTLFEFVTKARATPLAPVYALHGELAAVGI